MMWIVLLAGCLVDEALYRDVRASFRDGDADDVTPREGDCDDGNDQIAPGLAELCDGLDNDCDGVVDEDPKDQFWYADQDGDGFGSSLDFEQQCESPGDGYTIDPGDCDDTNAEIHPGATELCDTSDVDEDCDGTADNGDADAVGRRDWYADVDGDDFGDPDDVQTLCDQPAGYADNAEDCDDADEAVWPGQTEVCNGKDDDCDGGVDLDPTDGVVYFADGDTDGFGDPLAFVVSCVEVAGHVIDGTDCDDADAAVNPEQVEICDPDQRDEDCDTFVDDGDTSATGQDVFFGDADGDGHGIAGAYVVTCDPPIGYGVGTDDCDDADATRYPGAVEVCDTIDSDCDGSLDDADAVDAVPWYADADGDGHGTTTLLGHACTQPSGAAASSADCDDTRSDTWPGATETCDEVDNDCNGLPDDGAAAESVWYTDLDGDGFGAEPKAGCPDDAGYVATGGDCDDADADVSPGAQEICSDAEVDEDCDGYVDDGDPSVAGTSAWYTDADGDGHGDPATGTFGCRGTVAAGDDCDDGNALVTPGQYELCNGVDDDCDGVVDVGVLDGEGGYEDLDGDGFGGGRVCSGGIATGGDCDDAASAVSPSAAEICRNGVDDDCSGGDNDCLREGELGIADADAWLDGPNWDSETGPPIPTAWATFAWPGADYDGDGADDVIGRTTGSAEGSYAAYTGFPADLTDAWVTLDASTLSITAEPEPVAGGDVDGDGALDLVVAWPDDAGTGAAVVYSGLSEGGAQVVKAWGPTVAWEFAPKLSFEADLDGDGADDLAFVSSVYGTSSSTQGAISVWRGPVTGELAAGDAWAFLVGEGGDGGIEAATACDLDGDGITELYAGQSGWSGVGRVVGFPGPLGGGEALADGDTSLEGPAADAGAGSWLWCSRSVSGDGTADLFVAAPGGAGHGYLLTDHPVGDGTLASTAWLTVEGTDADAAMGTRGRDGDLDGDGVLDLVVGAPGRDAGAGAAFVFYAPTGGTVGETDADLVVVGDTAGEAIGGSIAMADIDGDGDDDLLLSAPGTGGWTSTIGRSWWITGGTR